VVLEQHRDVARPLVRTGPEPAAGSVIHARRGMAVGPAAAVLQQERLLQRRVMARLDLGAERRSVSSGARAEGSSRWRPTSGGPPKWPKPAPRSSSTWRGRPLRVEPRLFRAADALRPTSDRGRRKTLRWRSAGTR
jgi:hypothetical protein